MEIEIMTEINKLCDKFIKLREIYKNCISLIREIRNHEIKEEEKRQLISLEIYFKCQTKEVNEIITETLEKIAEVM